jgi:membrane fusion protein, multidrug efflux system
MTKLRRYVLTGLAGVLIAGGVAAVMSRPATVVQQKGGRWGGGEGPVPVRVASAVAADVPIYLDAVGAARALNTVTVQPQVGGKLIEVAFREGQTVQKGQVLARIDPATYQAALDQALAKQRQDESTLANAQLDLERYTRIPGTIAVKTVDTQRALVAQLTSQVASSKAAVDQAQVQLNYTQIVAPATGRTGIRQVDEGNIISGSASQSIVTITQVQPIAVLFNLPQQQLAQVNRASALGALVVDAVEADNKTLVDRGELRVVDNQVDQTTGTVKMKAEFPNEKLQLWPGQFVNVRVLIETLGQAITVPTAAVQRGPTGTFVYAVTPDNHVALKVVTVQMQDDTRAVITSGVKPGDSIVTSGFARLKEGAEVAVATTEQLEQAPVAPKRESQRGEGRRKREGAAPADGKPAGAEGEPPAEGKGKRGEGRRKRENAAPSATAPAAPETAPAVAPAPAPAGPAAGAEAAPSPAPPPAPASGAPAAPTPKGQRAETSRGPPAQ